MYGPEKHAPADKRRKDPRTHLRVARAQRQTLGLCYHQRDMEKTITRIVDGATRTHLRSNRKQQIVPRNGNPHPQEMDQTRQGSAALWTEIHESIHRDRKVQTTSHFSLLPTHGIRRRTRATRVLRAPEAHRQVQEDEHARADWRRLQRTSRSKRRTRSNRRQIHGKTRSWRAKQQRTVSQTLGSPAPADTATHILQKKKKTRTKQQTTQQSTATNSTTYSLGASFKHCKDADATGQIDMNSDHKAAISQNRNCTIDHKNQQIQRSTKKKAREATQRR